MTGNLEYVKAAAQAHAVATEALRKAVVDAKTAGENVSDLGRAAGVTRQTIYRWIALEGERADPEPHAAIRSALRALTPWIEDPYQRGQIEKRIGTKSDGQLLIALRMLRSWLPVDFSSSATEEERVALGLAASAENRLKADHVK